MRWLARHATIGRAGFAIGLGVSVAVLWLGIRASEAALPWMAEVLAPRGINAGFALNAIWSLLGLAFVCSVSVLGAMRLRARGRSGWWAPAAVVPLALLALAEDAIFLVSRTFVLPAPVKWTVLLVAGGMAFWVLVEGLIGPSRQVSQGRP
jgi:uncharacterized membrane protein YhaH (DUF805 family)